MFQPRTFLLLFFLLITFTWLFSSGIWEKTKTNLVSDKPQHLELADHSLKKLQLKAASAKLFVQQKGYNDAICFLVDMGLPSGQNRFFVYDFKKDAVVTTGLVTHGGGSITPTEVLLFSNTANSNATSIGRYKIGNEYSGKFGIAFKLYGLDKTNSNAFNRYVVLHSHSCVPAQEVYPSPICTSLGCPTVAPSFFLQLEMYIRQSDKPILLWIYY